VSGGPAVLIIDDEAPIRRLLHRALAVQDYEVTEARTAGEALAALQGQRFDVVLLDLGLPDRDGLELIREIRQLTSAPIVVLSSRDQEAAKVSALDLGADDYLTKPFGIEELMARIRTALRHRFHEEGARPTVHAGDVQIDLVYRKVTRKGVEVKLSPKEYAILAELAKHAGKVLTHRHLLRSVWGSEIEADVQYLRVYVRQLRQKLEASEDRPALIVTEPGVGYRLQGLIENATTPAANL
jgi:two-component system KDP operon response regulator KdpE